MPIRWIVSVERGLTVEADHDQLFRVLVNVARNAVQALEARGARDPARDQIRITGRREGSVVVIEVSDTGPGVSDKARAHMFEAFQGSTRAGGTGLGLGHRRRTGARAWRRHRLGAGHHRRDLPHHAFPTAPSILNSRRDSRATRLSAPPVTPHVKSCCDRWFTGSGGVRIR